MVILPPAFKVTAAVARQFMRRALLLDAPAPDIATALNHHGFVQIDPINVCGRMHDLILRNRVANYQEGDLMRHVHGVKQTLPAESRVAFEHHQPATGNLAVFTHDAWPHLQAVMRARTRHKSAWSGRLTKAQQELIAPIFDAIRETGPLSSDAITDNRRAKRVWGMATLPKSTMQKLFFHGRLMIAQRQGIRRLYDLPERVLPTAVLKLPEPKKSETERWEALLKIRQRRLVMLKRTELASVEDLVQPVQITDGPLLHCLIEDVSLFDLPSPTTNLRTLAPKLRASNSKHRSSNSALPSPTLLIAPLDPLIYDRRVTQAVWDYDYIWEVYTPPAKRVRGYYALPALSGSALVGHVDPKADRKTSKLIVVSRQVRRGHATKSAELQLARFLGLRI
jgi:uncharacterized protein